MSQQVVVHAGGSDCKAYEALYYSFRWHAVVLNMHMGLFVVYVDVVMSVTMCK